jgi:hypothetical protein
MLLVKLKDESDCVAFVCGYNHSRLPSVFTIFLDEVEQCWNEADISCPEFEMCLSVIMFSVSLLFSIYHNEFCVLFFLLTWQVML